MAEPAKDEQPEKQSEGEGEGAAGAGSPSLPASSSAEQDELARKMAALQQAFAAGALTEDQFVAAQLRLVPPPGAGAAPSPRQAPSPAAAPEGEAEAEAEPEPEPALEVEPEPEAEADPEPALLYRLAPAADWAAAKASGAAYEGGQLDRDSGFVHLSTHAQAATTAALYFKGKADTTLLTIDAAKLPADALKWELVPQREDKMPHLYCALPLAAVVEEVLLELNEAGEPVLPPPEAEPLAPTASSDDALTPRTEAALANKYLGGGHAEEAAAVLAAEGAAAARPATPVELELTKTKSGFGMIIADDGTVSQFNGADSVAEAGGVTLGSRITAVNGMIVASKAEIVAQLGGAPPADPVLFAFSLPQDIGEEATAAEGPGEPTRPSGPSVGNSLRGSFQQASAVIGGIRIPSVGGKQSDTEAADQGSSGASDEVIAAWTAEFSEGAPPPTLAELEAKAGKAKRSTLIRLRTHP